MAMTAVCALPARAMLAAPRARAEQAPRSRMQAMRAAPVTIRSARLSKPVGGVGKRMEVRMMAAGSMSGPADDGNVTMITTVAAWEDTLKNAGDKLVVLDISTKTCGPCKLVYPHFVQLSKDNEDIVFVKMFGEVNQETRDLMKAWGVRTVPQFHFWQKSAMVDQLSGSHPDVLKKKIIEVSGKIAA